MTAVSASDAARPNASGAARPAPERPVAESAGAPVNLLDLDRAGLEAFMGSLGEKPFRARQILKWLHQRRTLDVHAMTDVSAKTRTRLADLTTTALPSVRLDQRSRDGTAKWLFELHDGNRIETVYIPEEGRGTLCISSQVGCALDCSFCATGRQGFNRNLSVSEIIGQLWLAADLLAENPGASSGRITNVVMMGMGEPLLNYAALVPSLRLMMDDLAWGLSKRRVTVSTSGVIPWMDRLTRDVDCSLAVSLHAPNDALRDELVPVNRKYPIRELMAACRRYVDSDTGGAPDGRRGGDDRSGGGHPAIRNGDSGGHDVDARPALDDDSPIGRKKHVLFEYVMLDGVNDSAREARELAELLHGFPCKVNLIPFNPFPTSGYRRSSGNAVMRFSRILAEAGIVTLRRTTRGDDIDAACGQLAGDIDDRSRRELKFVEPRFGEQFR